MPPLTQRRLLSYATIGLALVALVAVGLAANSSAQAANTTAVNWNQVHTISISDGQDADLVDAANLLRSHFIEIANKPLTIATGAPANGSIHLSVNANDARLAGLNFDAFAITTSADSVRIVGKTSLAALHGATHLLDLLGVRWLGPTDAWTINPDSLNAIAIDKTREPSYEHRQLSFTPGHTRVYDGAQEETEEWLLRNGVTGSAEWPAHHTWSDFAGTYDLMAEDPTSVCYLPDGITPRQALPYHPLVIERAKQYARDWFDKDPTGRVMSVPISPPDGNMIWCNEWRVNGSYDSTTITNYVFELTNEVARMLQEEYPGKYASVLSYSWYSNVPTIPLEPNVYVQIVDFARGDQTKEERLAGFQGQPVIGIKDFIDVWEWWNDRIPPANKIPVLVDDMIAGGLDGHSTYVGKVSDGWAAKGRVYWLATRLLWDPALSIDALLADYNASAFGPALDPMRRFYHRFDTRYHDETVYGLAFEDLADAHAIALQSGDSDLVRRIEDVIYHTYFWWKWGKYASEAYGTLGSISEAKEIYAYVGGVKNFRIITYREHESILRNWLGQFATSQAELDQLIATPLPSAGSILNTALSAWDTQQLIDTPRIDLSNVELTSHGPSSGFSGTRFGGWGNASMVVQVDSPGTLTVEANIDSVSIFDVVTIRDSAGEVVGEINVDGRVCPCVLNIPVASPGRYFLDYWHQKVSVGVNHPAALNLTDSVHHGTTSPFWKFAGTNYFYVPQGTPAIELRLSQGHLNMQDPTGAQHTVNAPKITITNPEPGLWTLTNDGGTSGSLIMAGIPALLWHDPNQLLVPVGAYSTLFDQDLVRPADETLEDGTNDPPATQAPQPTATPTQAPQPTATPISAPQPTATPTPVPTQAPVATATPAPTQAPVATATPAPQATATPDPAPTQAPVVVSAPPPPPAPTPSVVAPVVRQPGAPSEIDVEPGDEQLVFTITRPEDDGGGQILGYRILDQETGAASRHDLQAFQYFDEKFTIVLSDLENGVLKSFEVKAYNEAGFGPAAIVGPVAPGLPESPEPVDEPVVIPTPTTVAPPLFGAAEEPPTEETDQVEPSATPITVVQIPTPTPTPTPIPVPTQAPVPTATPRSAPTQVPSVSTPEPEEIVVPTTGELITQEIEVESGWNLISFRVVPEDTELADVLEPLFDILEEVKIVNNGVTLSLTKDELEDSNIILDPMIGYWTRVSESATFEVDGLEVDPTVELVLAPGWTVISYLPDDAMTPAEALASIAGKYDEVRALDGEASTFLPALPAEFNTLLLMEPGQGYMIHITEEAVLSFP